jgi:hypothetical protein
MPSSTSVLGLSHVELLNGDNHHRWKVVIEDFLSAQGLWAYVQGRPRPEDAERGASPTEARKALERQQAWDDKNRQAVSVMLSSIESTRRSIIPDAIKGDARACWAAVAAKYGELSVYTVGRIRAQIHGVKYVDGASMHDHIAAFAETQRQLLGTSMAINDSTLAWLLIMSMPESFDALAAQVNYSSGQDKDGTFTFEKVSNAFLREEQRRLATAAEAARVQQTVAFYHRGQGSYRTSPPPSQPSQAGQQASRERATCSHCGRNGHLHTKCYILHPEQAPAGWTAPSARGRSVAEAGAVRQAALVSSGRVSLGPRNDFDAHGGVALVHVESAVDSALVAHVASTGAGRSVGASAPSGDKQRWLVDSAASAHYCLS